MSDIEDFPSDPGAAAGVSIIAGSRRERASASRSRSGSPPSRGKDDSTSPGSDTYRLDPAGESSSEKRHGIQRNLPENSKKPGGFLVNSAFANGHLRRPAQTKAEGKKRESNVQTRPAQKIRTPKQALTGSLPRSSPLSREVSVDDPYDGVSRSHHGSRQPSLDPAQLVQMALNLSESRKRHVSGSLPSSTASGGGRQMVASLDFGQSSAGSTPTRIHQTGRLNENALQPRRVSQRPDHVDHDGQEFGAGGEEGVVYRFSPATLSRAEKARRYYELASEHRRLLDHLPPLASQSSATAANKNDSIRSKAGILRSLPENGTPAIGTRSYNPLQALRNRRLRTREKRQLPTPPDAWQDLDQTKNWVDSVVAVFDESDSRLAQDSARLPKHPGEMDDDHLSSPHSVRAHRRTGTAASVITRPENGWTIEPAELLADAYWVEKGTNKRIIMDRNGDPVFPPLDRVSLDESRLARHETSNNSEFDSRYEQEASEDDSNKKPRPRHVLPSFGRVRRERPNFLSRSDTSLSSVESSSPLRFPSGDDRHHHENTAPLERHMRELIDKDQRGELSPVESLSPDRWNSTPAQLPRLVTNFDRPLGDSVHPTAGELSGSGNPRRRRASADNKVRSFHEDIPSNQDPLSSIPSSGLDIGSNPNTAIDAALESSKPGPSKALASGNHLLPDSGSPRVETIERYDFAGPYTPPMSPRIDADRADTSHTRMSLDSKRPFMKHHKTTESNTSDLLRLNTATSSSPTEFSTKDPARSLGRRILKGGRIGEIVRNEGSRLNEFLRIRDRGGDKGLFEVSKAASNRTDSDDERFEKSAVRVDSDHESGEGSLRESLERNRPNLKHLFPHLPSLNSPQGKTRPALPSAVLDDGPLSNTGRRAHPEDRQPPRSNQLPPPRFSLTDDDTGSNRELYLDAAGFEPDDGRRQIPGPAISTGINKGSLRAADDADVDRNKLSAIVLPELVVPNGQTRWSISNQLQTQDTKSITMREVERSRALLLASGIKAHEILRKSTQPRDFPLPVFAKAAATTGQDLTRVPVNEEHMVVAHALSSVVSTTLSEFDAAVRSFRDQSAKTSIAELEHLQYRVRDQLTQLVHDASDEADAFNVELTTKQPQDVKRVNDAVDAILRQRRRRFRLVRRAGFKMLELLVLAILWGLWLLVVMFNTVRGVSVAILTFLRWLLWF